MSKHSHQLISESVAKSHSLYNLSHNFANVITKLARPAYDSIVKLRKISNDSNFELLVSCLPESELTEVNDFLEAQ
jgi:hypothetical protein